MEPLTGACIFSRSRRRVLYIAPPALLDGLSKFEKGGADPEGNERRLFELETGCASGDPCNNQRNKPTDIGGPSTTEIGHLTRSFDTHRRPTTGFRGLRSQRSHVRIAAGA